MVYFKHCEIGDVYNSKAYTCDTCSKGTYSLQDPYDSLTQCKECPENAECVGGNIIPPKVGYYRYNTNSDKYIKCEVGEACLGGFIDEKYYPQGLC